MKRRFILGASGAPLGVVSGLSIVLSLFGASGCDTEAFCFECGSTTQNPDAGNTGGAGGMGQGSTGEGGDIIITSVGGSGGGSCTADLMTDPQNCGACGNVCNVPNAFSKCEGGFCLVDTCSAGWVDIDNQVGNGCEYKCTESNGGVEICDSVDNDCNGLIDELTDLQTDPVNCGTCNNVCAFANATAKCGGGACALDKCLVGYYDVNGSPNDGCEYACTVTNGGVEVCDYADNNCDTQIDEGFNLQTDAKNCGTCGNDCGKLYPNTVPTCDTGLCTLGACLPGFYNLDGIQVNGCEYACTPSGTEVCDGADNDCNGLIDDGVLPGVGDACGASNVGECELGMQACKMGSLVCIGEVKATFELCDNLDNDCTGMVDEGCPKVNASDKRLDLGTNSAVGQSVSTQLSVASLGNVVFAAYLDRRSGDADIRGNVSTDGGATWLTTADTGIAGGTLVQVEPWAFLSPTRAYVALAQFPTAAHRDVYIASAPSPYTAFTVPARVDKDTTNADAFLIRGVVARAGTQDTLVVVWQSQSGTGSSVTSEVWLQRSTNGGTTWLATDKRVNSVAGKAEQPSIATDGNGKVFIVWRDNRNGKSEVFASVYNADTDALSGNVAISGGNPAEQIAIAADTGGPNVYVAWTDLRSTKKLIRMARSTNSGGAFDNDGKIVNVDSTFADASAPTIAAASGRVVVAWEDTRSGVQDIWVNYSTDAGATFQTGSSRADNGTTPGTSASTKPRVALGVGDRVFLTWEDARSGQRDIYANHSFDKGATFQPLDLRLDVGMTGAPSPAGAADSRSPFITTNSAGTRGVVVWLDNRTTTGANGANADIYTNLFQ